MAYWLFKTEPNDYSWAALVADGGTQWDGVRNHQAANNMRAMQVDDLAFFYRSLKKPAVIGIMRVVRPAYPVPDDPDGPFVQVDVAPVAPLPNEVPLSAIKSNDAFADFALVRQSRLSVMQVGDHQWKLICRMGGLSA